MRSAPSPSAEHLRRVQRVLDYVGTHLSEPLDLERLAAMAHFSPWHFHRVFVAATGETVADCVRRLRLQAAAQQLLHQPEASVLAIALQTGFASPEVFSRSFRTHFGTTPTAWRHGEWQRLAQARQVESSKIHQAQRKAHQEAALALTDDAHRWPLGSVTIKGIDMHVNLRNLPAMRLAYLRHTGPYGTPGIPQTWGRFRQWCDRQGFLSPRRLMLGISQDNPAITPPDRLRYDCCVQVAPDYAPPRSESLPIGLQDFAAGRFACAHFSGMGQDLGAAWHRLYGEWLPHSGYEPADRPGFELYDEHFVLDEATGAFTCWLCLPIRGTAASAERQP